MRIAKWIVAGVAALVLLVALAVVIATLVVDPNRYRGKIAAIVSDRAGMPFVIEGDLKLTWFPWLGMSAGASRLGGPPGPPLVQWQGIEVAARLVPLIRGELIVDRIRVRGPHVRLRRYADGRGNWEAVGARGDGAPVNTRAPGSATAARQRALAVIAGAEIRDGVIEFQDDASGLHVTLAQWELEMGEWRPGQAFPLHTRFRVQQENLPAVGLPVEIDAPLGISMGDSSPVAVSPADSPSERGSTIKVSIPKLTLRVADARLDGEVTIEGDQGKGSMTVQVPSVRKLAADLALAETLPRDPTTLGKLELTARWDYRAGALAIKPLKMQVDGTTLEGWISRSAPPQSAWLFELHGDQIDLSRYVDVGKSNSKQPFELPVDALRALNANGSVVFDHAQLANARMKDVRLELRTPEPAQ